MRIAVLITCHNRVRKTGRCLESLFRQNLEGVHLKVFLVDDGCSDGTGEMARRKSPKVTVIPGDGGLYWNGGMNAAWTAANLSGDCFDAYLWLNDDVELVNSALETLRSCLEKTQRLSKIGAIVVGTVVDPHNGKPTYGGSRIVSRFRPLALTLLPPCNEVRSCDTFSGNVVMVSRKAFDVLGLLDYRFKHIFGDLDYGFRAISAGIDVCVAPYIAGKCEGWVPDESLVKNQSYFVRVFKAASKMQDIRADDWQTLVRLHVKNPILRSYYHISPYLKTLFKA